MFIHDSTNQVISPRALGILSLVVLFNMQNKRCYPQLNGEKLLREEYLCYVGVARVEGDWKTRGWDSNYILYCREDVHPTLQRSVCNCLAMIVGSSYIIQGVHYPHRSTNQCVPLHNRGRASLCLGRVQPVHNITPR